MSLSLDSLLDRLSSAERLELIDKLWASVEETALPSMLSDDQQAELKRRIEHYEANPDDVLSWEEVQQDLQARLP